MITFLDVAAGWEIDIKLIKKYTSVLTLSVLKGVGALSVQLANVVRDVKGDSGAVKVIASDWSPKMVEGLAVRAQEEKLTNFIEPRVLDGMVHFLVLFFTYTTPLQHYNAKQLATIVTT